ncbi:MAG: hypothetical protein PHC97_01815 [Patescibacteria group bacterium]|nr:hypothetical protein [Patescibacteria group bacterium]
MDKIVFSKPLSRTALVDAIRRRQPVSQRAAKKLALHLAKKFGTEIRRAVEKALKKQGAYSIMAISKLKPRISNEDGWRVSWPSYRWYCRIAGGFYEVTTSLAIVVCHGQMSSKLWVTNQLNALCVRKRKSFRVQQSGFEVIAIKTFLERMKPVTQEICGLIWPYYKRSVRDVLRQNTVHYCWFVCEGAETDQLLITPLLSRKEFLETIKHCDGYKFFIENFYLPLSKAQSNRSLVGEGIKELEKRGYPCIWILHSDSSFFFPESVIKDAYSSVDNKKMRPAYRLIGLASNLYPHLEGPAYQPFWEISYYAVNHFADAFKNPRPKRR